MAPWCLEHSLCALQQRCAAQVSMSFYIQVWTKMKEKTLLTFIIFVHIADDKRSFTGHLHFPITFAHEKQMV